MSTHPRPSITRWFGPKTLLRTGFWSFLSTVLGSMIDTRRLAPVQGTDQESIFDYSAERGELWFDYMADTGDGWEETYAMARLLSSEQLEVEGADSPLPRGRFLILGGDEVYPYASRDLYASRLVWPFNHAARDLYGDNFGDPPRRHFSDLFCIPGNHDWYDSLEAFTRRFCNQRWVGCFYTRQKRSYFVLKLPFNWQIWAADVQLRHDVDVAQFRFFKDHAASDQLSADDRVMLCLAEPDWVNGEEVAGDLPFQVELFERLAAKHGSAIRLELAGDVHNYQRYEPAEPGDPLKVVSGGGGAFLHPTHKIPTHLRVPRRLGSHRGLSEPPPPDRYTCEHVYPSAAVSWLESLWNLAFAFLNPTLSLLLGVVYWLLFAGGGLEAGDSWWTHPLEFPLMTLIGLGLVGGLVAFADGRGFAKVLLGGLHGAAHIVGAVLSWRAATELLLWLGITSVPLAAYGMIGATLLAGTLIGGTIFGLYLLIATSFFGLHENESFSAVRVRKYKHFIRFHLTAERLCAYVLAVDRPNASANGSSVQVRLEDTFEIRTDDAEPAQDPEP